jgi:SOS response associated peptidase (SRAP)
MVDEYTVFSLQTHDSIENLKSRTCTTITAEPNELVAQIHPRMPVILPEQNHAAWLGETDDGNLKAMLLPCPADQMLMWEISPQVNSPKNDDVNTGSDRDDGKRLTRFDVAISHIGFAGSNDEPSGRKTGSRDKAL